ncbi:MAG: TM0106 family RecB-like putative nuclease [Propionibacteriaceae bacterium]|nr:TM0106 family RecB-like putative nuclease [Propionibacteriaceae bacterium]
MTTTPTPFALDQCAATCCPVKTQNAFNALIPHPQPVDTLEVEEFREVSHHRSNVMKFLLQHHEESILDLSAITDPKERALACASAMARGVPIILYADLPTDWAHHRKGRADVLVKDEHSKKPIYHPGIIKDRPVLSATTKNEQGQLTGSLTRPFLHQARLSANRYRIESQADSLLQLAHLWYMIQAAGYASTEAWGVVIGADHEDRTNGCVISWMNLNDKIIRAFSYTGTHQWRKYSALSRYQHEHRFRVRVATHALQQSATGRCPALVASPVRIPECDMCEWWPECQSSLTDDISVKIERSPLDAREIMTLRNLGISTITDLTTMDIDQLLPTYLPRVAHRAGAESRLRLAAHRGRLLATGTRLERLSSGPIPLPSAPVEIDLDIETSASNHVYLWGFLVHDRREKDSRPVYHPIHRFQSLNTSKELDLAEEAAGWLMEYILSLDDTPVLVWHYSTYEPSTLRRFARTNEGSMVLAWLNSFAQTHFIDLFSTVKEHFFGVDGLGLKAMASAAAGFSWRDTDPSGLNSQYWFSDAIHAPTPELRNAARTRILEYNEDDVRATWALRTWIRSLT